MKKTVLITGAAGGIGSATAREFAKKGFNIVLNYHTAHEQAKALAHEFSCLGVDVLPVYGDVSDIKSVRQMVSQAENEFGFVDVLVNNAGISQQKLFTDLTEQDYDRMFDVNVRGTFNCCQCVLPSMIAHKSGKIVNVSSMWGISGASCEVHYSASKAAVIGLTKALAKEVGPSNIYVNCVAPGLIDTRMNSNLDASSLEELKNETPLCRIGKPEEVAQAILFFASEESNFVTGQVLSVDGGIIL